MTSLTSSWQRRKLLLLPAAAGLARAGSAWATSLVLPIPTSLKEALERALRAGHPLTVMVSLEGCPFCRVVRDNYLRTLLQENVHAVVQVNMRSSRALLDFRGVATTHDELVRTWNVQLAPTLMFIGLGGQEAAARLVGASLTDFYGAYLDDRVRIAQASLNTLR